MESNYIIINGWKIAIAKDVAMQYDSPLTDKTYIFYAGQKQPCRGETSLSFDLVLSQLDLSNIGFPHLVQNASANNLLINGVLLYNNGVQVFNGTLLLTDIDRDLDTGAVKASAELYDPVTAFVNAITATNVNQLAMDGVRVIDGSKDWYSAFGLGRPAQCPAPTQSYPGAVNVNQGTTSIYYTFTFPETYFPTSGYSIPTLFDMRGQATSDYASCIVRQGDPYICFPVIRVVDSDNGNTWLNWWDPRESPVIGFKAYSMVPDMTGPGGSQNGYTAYQVTDLENHVTPMYFYSQVIRHCFSEMGYTLNDPDGFLSDPHFMRLTLVNNFDILNAMTVSFENTGPADVRTVGYWQRTTVIDPANHLPTDSIQDFLLDFMLKFNCFFQFNGSTATLMVGDFETVDRELTDYSPKIKIENTIDTGLTLGYDFPDDKNYDPVKNIAKTTFPYDPNPPKFPLAAGVNDVYLANELEYPNPQPISGPVPDRYFALLRDDIGMVLLVDSNSQVTGSVVSGSYPLPIPNAIPVSLGVQTRPDSPKVNLQQANQANTTSYNLKYPPVCYGDPTFQDGISNNRLTTDIQYVNMAYQGTSSNGITYGYTGPLIITTQPLLGFEADDVIQLIAGYNYNSDISIWAIGAILTATVTAYIPSTGQLNINVTAFTSNGSGGVTNYVCNNWYVYKPLPDSVTGIADISALYATIPTIQAPVVTMGVQDIQYVLSNYSPTTDYVYATMTSTGSTINVDGLWKLYFPLQTYIPSGISSAISLYMPSNWIKMTGSQIVESGFYWGLQAVTATPDTPGLYHVPGNEILPISYAEISDTHSGFVGSGLTLPLMTSNEQILGNSSVAPGWFNLSLLGPLSIPKIFWTAFINQYIYNRRVTLTVYETLMETRAHKFNNAVMWRGSRLYITQINYRLKDRYDGAVYLGFLI